MTEKDFEYHFKIFAKLNLPLQYLYTIKPGASRFCWNFGNGDRIYCFEYQDILAQIFNALERIARQKQIKELCEINE